jgi:hypothetical protein
VRAQGLAESIARRPDAGFPSALGSEAEVEAFYRLMNNPAVEPCVTA